MTNIWEGRGNQYIQLVKVLYCKLPTNSKQLYQLSHLRSAGNRIPISEVGGESVTTLPLWPLTESYKRALPFQMVIQGTMYLPVHRIKPRNSVPIGECVIYRATVADIHKVINKEHVCRSTCMLYTERDGCHAWEIGKQRNAC